MKLDGKIAIVTGSGRGIGRAIAIGLAKEGAKVVVNVSKNIKEGEKTCRDIELLGGEAILVKADVSNKTEVNRLIEETLMKWKKIDILVCNAGIFRYRPGGLVEIPEEEWDEVLKVNLKGTYYCCKAVIPHMIERKYGKILFISSVQGIDGFAGAAHYAASKGAMNALAKSLAKELGRYGINVNVLALGITDTRMLWDNLPKEVISKVTQRIILRRIGKPKDIAKLTVFLCTDDSSYITAQIIRVDGGR